MRGWTDGGSPPTALVRLPSEWAHDEQDAAHVLPWSVILVLLVVAMAAAGRGAFHHREQLMVGAVIAASVIAAIRRDDFWKAVWSPINAAAALLAGWALLRGAIGGDVAAGLGSALLLVAAGAIVSLIRIDSVDYRGAIVTWMLVIGMGVSLSGWVGLVLRWEPLALPSQGVWRAATTITYPNAAAALLVALALLGLGRFAEHRGTNDALMTMVLITGAATTLSRAGVVAGVLGLLALGGLLGWRRLAATALPPLAGAVVAFAGVIPSFARSSEPHPLLATVGLIVGLIITVRLTRAPARRSAGIVITVAALVLLTSIAFVAGGPSIEDFSSRLVPADRLERWSAALERFFASPIGGEGPGPFWVSWQEHDRTVGAWFVHNEYLQLLVQLGLIGMGLLVILGHAIVRSIRQCRAASPPALWAGVAAALLAIAVHSAFDFLWHVPALPLFGALMIGVVTAAQIEEERTE